MGTRCLGKESSFSPPNVTQGSQTCGSDSHLASPGEAMLKMKPPKEEGTAEKCKGQQRPEDMRQPDASPIPGFLIDVSQYFPVVLT